MARDQLPGQKIQEELVDTSIGNVSQAEVCTLCRGSWSLEALSDVQTFSKGRLWKLQAE